MYLRNFILAAGLALIPITSQAATLVVPAAGSGPGSRESRWQTELTLRNAAARAIAVTLTFHDASGPAGQTVVAVPARRTIALHDVITNSFEKPAATGAIGITLADQDAAGLAVTSRTINVSANGEFGQDIPPVNLTNSATTGALVALLAPVSVASDRFNFGIYAATETAVRWELIRDDGSVVATNDSSYPAGSQRQYNSGVASFFGAVARDNDVIHATVQKGSALFYGSAINQSSGDPAYIPGVRVREELRINFLGIDRHEKGTVDYPDADHDGTVDVPIDIATSSYPAFFRIVSTGENNERVRYELLDAGRDVMLIDDNGTVEWAPGGDLKGSRGALKVRATSASSTGILTIPVNFR